MPRWTTLLTLAAVSSCWSHGFASAQEADWPRWRGPEGTGVAPQADPPVEWSETKNVKWKVEVPGEGHGTPIVWQDRIFLMTAIPTSKPAPSPAKPDADAKTTPPTNLYQFVVLCLDRESGETVWQKVARESAPREGRHTTNSYASASPVTDGERLYASFGSEGLYCYDLGGKLLWEKDLGDMRTRSGWGEGASPAVSDGVVIVNWDHEDNSFIVALDAKTGDEIWRKPRDEPTSWGTPLIVEHDGTKQVIVNATNRVRSYELSTGKVLWECGGQTVNAIPTPVADDEVVYVTSGYRGSLLVAVPLDARGDITGSEKVLWSRNRGTPYVPSPVLVNNRLYFTAQNTSALTCVNVKTGEVVFGPERLPGISNVYASPVAADGRIYFAGREGTTVVVEASDKFTVLTQNTLDTGIDASPAIVGKQLFLRGTKHLYCIEE
jgi:outer membrane protein assembly factor BamB